VEGGLDVTELLAVLSLNLFEESLECFSGETLRLAPADFPTLEGASIDSPFFPGVVLGELFESPGGLDSFANGLFVGAGWHEEFFLGIR
jgi:hypothetical protein